MKFRGVAGALAALCCVTFSGCIPDAPSATPAFPNPEISDNEVPVPPPVEPARENGGGIGLLFHGFEQSNVGVEVAKMGDSNGYTIKGSYGLEGTITKPEEGPWQLFATFQFPTGGFSVGTPYFSALGTDVQDPEKDLEAYSGLIIINIPVKLPARDAMVTQAIQEVPVHLDINAPADASFSVVLVSQ